MSVICPNCGAENENGSAFCVVCGSRLDVQDTVSQGYQEPEGYQQQTQYEYQEQTEYQQQQNQQQAEYQQQQNQQQAEYQQPNNNPGRKDVNPEYLPKSDPIFLKLGNGLDAEDEYVVATLSNGVVRNLMTGDGVMSESIFVTNRRLYYNYNSGIFTKDRVSERVDIKDITGTKVRAFSPNLLLVIAAIIFLGSAYIDSHGEGIFQIGMVVAIIFVIAWAISKKQELLIQYAGGDIALDVKGYSRKQVMKFQSIIHALKDQVEK